MVVRAEFMNMNTSDDRGFWRIVERTTPQRESKPLRISTLPTHRKYRSEAFSENIGGRLGLLIVGIVLLLDGRYLWFGR